MKRRVISTGTHLRFLFPGTGGSGADEAEGRGFPATCVAFEREAPQDLQKRLPGVTGYLQTGHEGWTDFCDKSAG